MNVAPLTSALADRYRIERELGAGGMATVSLAHDIKHRRQVAIKVLRPELAAMLGRDPDAIWILNSLPSLQRLRREPRYQALLARMGMPGHMRQAGR